MIFQQQLCRPEGIHIKYSKLKSKDLQPRLLYPARLSFRAKAEIKSLLYKKKLKEFITSKPVLQKNVKGTSLGRKDKDMNKKI